MKELTVKNPEELMLKLACTSRPRKLQAVVERFWLSDDKIRELVPDKGEYASAKSLTGSMTKAVQKSGHRIRVVYTHEHVYLVKEDFFNEYA
ncbi:MAG: hypothetical protein II637_01915 [Bacteroidales bacterium]|nr:hypothetical protein [Bacteroidales bacterium]